ncbi:MAG: transposase IS4 family protein [Bacteroidetes bacterium 38_7]|nr:MAG: transposase IS4 family protein [Bacteroidetes bacterium 38_7]HAL64985.1 hypothetical protein [Bacteroidales bacterium]
MEEKSAISLKRARELTRNMYQISYTLPELKQTKSKLLNMDEEQAKLYRMVRKNFQGVPLRETGMGYILS